MRIWLDDLRPAPRSNWLGEDEHWDYVVKTAHEAIELVKTGTITYISFDHDLGPEKAGTGYDVARFIEEQAFLGTIPPIDYALHSANPVGRANIDKAMKRAWSFWEKDQ